MHKKIVTVDAQTNELSSIDIYDILDIMRKDIMSERHANDLLLKKLIRENDLLKKRVESLSSKVDKQAKEHYNLSKRIIP